jgi:putative Mg2+ transporter-C (MgtC) family protein
MLLGGVVGLQRERWGKSAGPRTYGLVAGGAALFTSVALVGFGGPISAPIAAGIITGIGFLGAGIIFKNEQHVDGLTTAAGLWTIAAVGMTVGIGREKMAILATILILAMLMLDDSRFRRKNGTTMLDKQSDRE